MKKIRIGLLSIVSFLFVFVSANALECEQNVKDAMDQVNIDYKYINSEPSEEVIEKYIDERTHSLDLDKLVEDYGESHYQIIITGLKENMYVEITNTFDDEVIKLDNSNAKKGKIIYDGKSAYDKTSYNVKVYESTTNCEGILKTVTPNEIINTYYNTKECKDNPEFKYCKEKMVEKEISDFEFNSELKQYKEKKNKKNNVIVAIMILILIIVITTAILVWGRGKKKNEKNK